MAKEIFAFMSDSDKELIRKSWVLPLISMLTMHQHFNDIARALYPITDRALSQTLKLVEEAGWVVGADGIRRNAAGEPLTLTIIQFNPEDWPQT